MLSFYEMMNLMEGMRYRVVDGRLVPIGPAKGTPAAQQQAGSAEPIINRAHKTRMASPKASSYRGRMQLSKAIPDLGRHLDDEPVGKGHWIGNEEPDMSLKDITAGGDKQDVSSRPNPTRKITNPKTTVGYEADTHWEQMLDDKLDFIATVQDTTPEHAKSHIMALLKWNQELRKRPISPKLKDKTFEVDDVILDMLEKEDKSKGVPSQDKPKESPMAKYMLRKHSKVF